MLNVSATFFRIFEEDRNERFFGALHQLYNTLLNGVLVLIKPSIGIVLNLNKKRTSRIDFLK